MSSFEILCVTMHQSDFSKIQEMNVHSNIIFANQCDRTGYDETCFEGQVAKMISTQTRGVGKNRNIALLYATAEICLFADDDVRYVDGMEEIVKGEFDKHPDADIFIFHLDTDDEKRKQVRYPKTRKCKRWERMPWGGVRIAVRLSSIRSANVWFNTLFGGGCTFPSGEDSIWLIEAKRKGLKFYVSNKTIGTVSFETSTWFTGRDEKYYFARGAFYAQLKKRFVFLWYIYFALRTKNSKLSFLNKIKWMRHGKRAYKKMQSFDEYIKGL